MFIPIIYLNEYHNHQYFSTNIFMSQHEFVKDGIPFLSLLICYISTHLTYILKCFPCVCYNFQIINQTMKHFS